MCLVHYITSPCICNWPLLKIDFKKSASSLVLVNLSVTSITPLWVPRVRCSGMCDRACVWDKKTNCEQGRLTATLSCCPTWKRQNYPLTWFPLATWGLHEIHCAANNVFKNVLIKWTCRYAAKHFWGNKLITKGFHSTDWLALICTSVLSRWMRRGKKTSCLRSVTCWLISYSSEDKSLLPR